ncbi:hypothetical protein XarbCFBP7610_16305 [Xanthomonas arboricola]|nr:hypothetical protein XarbCFBP7610_16305 [Xanthomonas arboricola]
MVRTALPPASPLAPAARGKADGEDVTQRNSHLSAGNTATIISGNDTTLKGAVLSADTVLADIGGNLTSESPQDTSSYETKGISLSGGYAAGGSDGKEGAKTETQTPPTTNQGSSWSWQNQGSGAQGASAGYSSKSVSDVLAALNRDVLTGDSANGLVKGWDGQKLQQQVSAGPSEQNLAEKPETG